MKRDETEAKSMTYNVIAKKMTKEENIKEVNLPKCNAFISTQGSHNKKTCFTPFHKKSVFVTQMTGVGDDAHYMPKKFQLHFKERGRDLLCQ